MRDLFEWVGIDNGSDNQFNWPIVLVTVITAALLGVTLYALRRNVDEEGISYSVAVPEQCQPGWEGEVLDDLQIKVYDTFPSQERSFPS